MERVSEYRRAVKETLGRYHRLLSEGGQHGLESHLVFDEARDEYLLVKSGWLDGRRVRGTVAHVVVRDGKVWIEEDWTEDGLATDLLAVGVPPDAIVLAFQPPEMRQFSEFAVA